MNNPIKKRSNPFATAKNNAEETKEEVTLEKQEEKAEEPVYNEPVKVISEPEVEEVEEIYEEPVVPVVKQQPVRQQKQKIAVYDDPQREKFTSTMDVTLRRRIKIICATQGIMFSEFIEQACLEKIKREHK